MSTRPDLLPPQVIRELETLQDDVGGFGFRDVVRTFVEDFGRPPDQLYATIDREPIASASVAQVHRAVLADGREVAVKVRRPRVDQVVSFDLAVMRLFARVVALVPSFRLLAPVESVEEFGRAIRTQIDLTVEAANNLRFRADFAADPDVELPELVPSLCSERILTMTFVHGVKLFEHEKVGADPTRLARIGFRLLLRMVFENGFVHADLHPGNILVTPRGTVALLDLGLTAELDEHHRRIFAIYFAAWAQGDGATMARIMAEFSPSARVPDYAAYEADIERFVARFHGKPLGEVAVSQVVFDMMGILRRHRVRANATFTMVNIAIAVTEGIGKRLDPRLDLLHEALPFFARLRAEARL
jgi:ubiquinone biosynthesis protein